MQKSRNLVELLYERTVDKKLTWGHDGADEISATLGHIVIYITKATNINFEEVYKIYLVVDGHVKDEFTDEDLGASNVPTGVVDMPNYFRLCEALFQMAARQATGADETIDAALAFLLAKE